MHRETKSCEESCRTELSLDQLSRGAAYEARLRVRTSEDNPVASVWSDWSAAVRWTSDVGEAAAPPAGGLRSDTLAALQIQISESRPKGDPFVLD